MAFTLRAARSQRRDAPGAGADACDVGDRPLRRLPHLHRAGGVQYLQQPASPGKWPRSCGRESGGHLCREQTGQYSGRYFVLMGHLSPLDGIGPDDIGPRSPGATAGGGVGHRGDPRHQPRPLRGEATANYIAELCAQYGVDASRIAHGVPVGGELEMVDGTTLSHSWPVATRLLSEQMERGLRRL